LGMKELLCELKNLLRSLTKKDSISLSNVSWYTSKMII
jgi:hypothetical protein